MVNEHLITHPYFSLVFCETVRSMMDGEPPSFGHSGTWESLEFPEGYEKPSKEEFEAKLQENLTKKAFDILRKARNKKLLECDWTQFHNSPLSETKKQEWDTYRQALRDLPANTEDPANPIWPDRPDETSNVETSNVETQ